MFRCQHCQKVSAHNEQPVRVIAETRQRNYLNGAIGREIVQEILVHRTCAADAQTVASIAEARRDEMRQKLEDKSANTVVA